MRPIWKDLLLAMFLGMVLPGILLEGTVMLLDKPGEVPALEEAVPQTVPLSMKLTAEDGGVVQMDMDDYLVGVVLAEMSASFEEEALKAQAVAARTYTRKAWETGGKHGDGSVCTNASCCQAYLPESAYLSRGGIQEDADKVRRAVDATSGQVLTYEGQLIEATYFSCSGGSTEDAVAVWGTEYPYLQAVESPGEENAAHYTDVVTFSRSEFQNALGVTLPGSPGSWFGPVTYTEGGGVASMKIGETTYSGTQLRSLLGLRSTNFTVSAGAEITITTKGYGHRVGMSQYGADAMAASGSSYRQILAHYYPGTELTLLEH